MPTTVERDVTAPEVCSRSAEHRRHVSVVAAMVAVAVLMVLIQRPPWWYPSQSGGPLTNEGGGGWGGSMAPGEVLWASVAYLENQSSLPAVVEQVTTREASDTIDVVGFRLMDSGPFGAERSSSAPAGSFELDDYRVRPSQEALPVNNETAILIGLSVEPGARGEIDGLDVSYRVGDDRYRLLMDASVTLCGYDDCEF